MASTLTIAFMFSHKRTISMSLYLDPRMSGQWNIVCDSNITPVTLFADIGHGGELNRNGGSSSWHSQRMPDH